MTPTGSVTISGAPAEDQVLNAANTLADEDGPGVITYQWQRNGVDIAGATTANYNTTSNDAGTLVSVVASYTDDQRTGDSVSSTGTAAVAVPIVPEPQPEPEKPGLEIESWLRNEARLPQRAGIGTHKADLNPASTAVPHTSYPF